LTAVTLGLGSLMAAQPGGHRRGGPGGPGGPGGLGGPGGFGGPFPMLRQLDLSDAQQEQGKGILDANKEASQAIHQRLAAAHKAQADAIEAQPTDEGLIRAKSSDLAAIEADAAVLRAKVQSAIFQVLTPEQQEKAKALKAEREKRMSEFRERAQERRQQRQQ